MDIAQLEALLHQDESDALDCKRDQYQFSGAPDHEKSKLLKDILAFANSWRSTTAYILIGVEEVQGGRSKIVGITEHLPEHSIQQFVNGKTNRPISFSYYGIPAEDVEIGVIEIPVQRRPSYIKNGFVDLKAEKVYIRRGSSTDIASLEEIHAMGEAVAAPQSVPPVIEVEFADRRSRTSVGATLQMRSTTTEYNEDELDRRRATPWDASSLFQNPDFEKEAARFVAAVFKFNAFTLQLKNLGASTARDIRMEVSIDKERHLELTEWVDLPSKPSKSSNLYFPRIPPITERLDRPRVDVTDHETHWNIQYEVGNLRPQEQMYLPETVYLGATSDCRVELDITIYAENLPAPARLSLCIEIESNRTTMSVEDIKGVEDIEFD